MLRCVQTTGLLMVATAVPASGTSRGMKKITPTVSFTGLAVQYSVLRL